MRVFVHVPVIYGDFLGTTLCGYNNFSSITKHFTLQPYLQHGCICLYYFLHAKSWNKTEQDRCSADLLGLLGADRLKQQMSEGGRNSSMLAAPPVPSPEWER